MDNFRDVQIFGIGGYVMSACIIDLIKSNLFKTILNNMNICDNCTEPIKIIMPDESSEVIKAAFNEVTWRPGLTIIQDNRYKSLLSRLGFLPEKKEVRHSTPPQIMSTPVMTSTTPPDPLPVQNLSFGDCSPSSKQQMESPTKHPNSRPITSDKENVKINPYRDCSHCGQKFYFTHFARHEKSCSNDKQLAKARDSRRLEKMKKYRKVSLRSSEVRVKRAVVRRSSSPAVQAKQLRRGSRKDKLTTCYYCGTQLPNRRTALYSHYTHKHFFEKIVDELRDPNIFVCHFDSCGYKAAHLYGIVNHVGVTHGVIKKFIPKHLHLKKMRRMNEDEDTVTKNKCKEKIQQSSDENIQNSPSKKCYLCQENYKNRTFLYHHLAYAHFYDQLKAFTKKSDEGYGCIRCNFSKASMYGIIIHLGSVHSLVEDYMPPEHRIAKKKGRKCRADDERERAVHNDLTSSSKTNVGEEFQATIEEDLTESEELNESIRSKDIMLVKEDESEETMKKKEYFENDSFSSKAALAEDFSQLDDGILQLPSNESLEHSEEHDNRNDRNPSTDLRAILDSDSSSDDE